MLKSQRRRIDQMKVASALAPPVPFVDPYLNDDVKQLAYWFLLRDDKRDVDEPSCDICGLRSLGDLKTDHDHETMIVRGYLCNSCNVSEGYGHFPAWSLGLNPNSVNGITEKYSGWYSSPVQRCRDWREDVAKTALEIWIATSLKAAI